MNPPPTRITATLAGAFSARPWLITVSLLLSSFSSGAFACSCVAPPADHRTAVKEAFQQATLVFVGRIESQEHFSRVEAPGLDFDYQRTEFLVLDSWKGEKAVRIYVQSGVTCCMCGYQFPKTGVFLVYAYGPDEHGVYSTSICTRTKPIDEAAKDIAVLTSLTQTAVP